jgi:hypothetical protein
MHVLTAYLSFSVLCKYRSMHRIDLIKKTYKHSLHLIQDRTLEEVITLLQKNTAKFCWM